MNDWRDRALCVTEDPELFTGDHLTEIQVAVAQSICGRCPARVECGEYSKQLRALYGREFHGVWAGQWHGPKPKPEGTCAADGCYSPSVGRGMCAAHYRNMRLYGSTQPRHVPAAVRAEMWAEMEAQGLSMAEAAERMGITLNGLETALRRARCGVADCGGRIERNGLCGHHLQARMANGVPVDVRMPA